MNESALLRTPDLIDAAAYGLVFGLLLGLPLVGYIFMVVDLRAWYRSLRRTLIVVRGYFTETPAWAQVPPCFIALGVQPPCTEAEVLAAYREKVKTCHPDRGGDKRRFLALQRHFEAALSYLGKDACGAHNASNWRKSA